MRVSPIIDTHITLPRNFQMIITGTPRFPKYEILTEDKETSTLWVISKSGTPTQESADRIVEYIKRHVKEFKEFKNKKTLKA